MATGQENPLIIQNISSHSWAYKSDRLVIGSKLGGLLGINAFICWEKRSSDSSRMISDHYLAEYNNLHNISFHPNDYIQLLF